MVYELLTTGKENARTARELAKQLDCDIRIITEQIEKERREGQPICAATGEKPGYYIAADAEELERYCETLKARGIEIFKTRQALVKTLKKILEAKQEA